ncbi:UDP-glycosyltransferase 82A1 [Abrus precatorius]|uniref:UDP-glycosyltransferase 82A1 n=1 Tax=Abrus precatorius TaxID=3816 RepID=A0A8B8MLZ6_ABRPR|nr:UDP-glycosyltransferase 82A1 [Abrus precatorius]
MKHLKKAKIILVPYPAQGHVSPMQKLAWAFLSHGFEPVIVLPQCIHGQILLNADYSDHGIKWVALPDGQAQEGDTGPDFFAIESAMENTMPTHLQHLLRKLAKDGDVACLVVDLLASWAIEVAHTCAIPVAGFWPAMLASYLLIASIPHMLFRGLISDTGVPQYEGKIHFEPELPVISTEDLPWLIGTDAARKARFKFWKRTMERSSNLKWVLVNSFPDEMANKCGSQGCGPHVLPIGPICMHQLTKTISFWEEDLSCMKWLENQKPDSVVYISFGSWVSPIGDAKLRNLALALEASARPFIWVLRSTWLQGLPVGFLERVVKQGIGRVVSWAPQTQILQHQSVACYLTHCGWNSILEALQFQKKLLCYPVAGDQFVNCAYVVKVWRVGLKLNGLGHKDVEEGVLKVMEDEEMSSRLNKLYQRIMGMQGDNIKGAFVFKTFLEDLKNPSSTTIICQNSS